MKQIFILLFIAAAYHTALSQKVELKKGHVLLDGKEILQYERLRMGNDISVSSLGGDDELFSIQRHDNETKTLDDDYLKIYFNPTKTLIENSTLNGYPFAHVIKLMVKGKVLTPEGKIDTSKMEDFANKYHENITARTIRH